MSIDDKYVLEIGDLVLRCKKVTSNDWDSLVLVFDIEEGHTANSGFLYLADKIRPISASIEDDPLLLDNAIETLREKIFEQSGYKFKQLLIQMEKESGRIKIDFEFDDPSRWAIKPSNMVAMRQDLKPNFS